jgi:hypothetical protein
MISEFDSGCKERKKNRFLKWHGKDFVFGSIQFRRSTVVLEGYKQN